MWLLPQKRTLAPRTIFHSRRFSMFDRLVLAFYLADSIENWGVFLSYDWKSKSNVYDVFAILFRGVTRWLLWFVNTVPFHAHNCSFIVFGTKIVFTLIIDWSWNKWTELFDLERDKIHNDGWRSGWY